MIAPVIQNMFDYLDSIGLGPHACQVQFGLCPNCRERTATAAVLVNGELARGCVTHIGALLFGATDCVR